MRNNTSRTLVANLLISLSLRSVLNASAHTWEEAVDYSCSTDTGPGVKGLNYNAYHKNCAACEADCKKLGWCVAYECSNHPATCNIWACQPTKVIAKHGHTCRWKTHVPTKTCAKKPAPAPAPAPAHPVPVVKHPPPPAPSPQYDEIKDHICRTDTGPGVKGLNYDTIHTNCAGCGAQCSKTSWCVAYQCSDHPATCNIWACQPTFVEEKKGNNCRWKKHVPTFTCAKPPVVKHPPPVAHPVVKHPPPPTHPVVVAPAPVHPPHVIPAPGNQLVYVSYNSLCRTSAWTPGSTAGWGVPGVDFDLQSGVKDCLACRLLCLSKGTACKALECNDNGHCEIWKTKPTQFEPKPNTHCGVYM